MGTKIVDRDKGAKALLKRIADAHKTTVSVGVHEAEGSAPEEGGLTVLDIATMHEFGGTDEHDNPSPPRRSFISDWADENEDKNQSDLRTIGQAVIEGKVSSLDQGLDRFGVRKVAEVQARIRAGIAPELAPSTVDRKGSSTPLIDSGQLITSITHAVKKE